MFIEIATRPNEKNIFLGLVSVNYTEIILISDCLQIAGASLGDGRSPIFI